MKSFIRFEYEEAIDARRQFLSSQLNILEFLKKVKNYKALRKRELILKGRLKKEFASLGIEINNLQAAFPIEKEEIKEIITIKKRARKKAETKENKNIEAQLQDIREKLASLS